jgi:uncharacterized protein (DUF697 family)
MSEKETLSNEIIKRYALYSAGAGLIPMPVVDMVAIGGVQLKMLAEVGKVYNLPFESDRMRPIVASLLGGYAATRIGYGVGGGFLKAIPLVGPVLGALSVPAFASGATWAIGRVFVMHFASGGTFLDFDADKMRAHFAGKGTAAA